MTPHHDLAEDERVIASVAPQTIPLVAGDFYITEPGAIFYNRARARWPALVQEVRELRAALKDVTEHRPTGEVKHFAITHMAGWAGCSVCAALARHEEGA